MKRWIAIASKMVVIVNNYAPLCPTPKDQDWVYNYLIDLCVYGFLMYNCTYLQFDNIINLKYLKLISCKIES